MERNGTEEPGEDRPSISAAFIENESFLKRFLRRFLSRPQDIEDVVQNTYLKARCAEEKRVISSPKSFLFRIAQNEALKELRKKSRRITDYIEDLDGPDAIRGAAAAEDEVIARQRLGIFCQSVLEMTPKCRRAFLMCKVYGMSYKDIASQLGITVSGVEKHVARGLAICNAHVESMEQPADDWSDGQRGEAGMRMAGGDRSGDSVVSRIVDVSRKKGEPQ